MRSQRRHLIVAALALGLGGGLAACGTSDEDEARAVVGEFRRAVEADDGERACRLLTQRARRELGDCEQAVGGSVTPSSNTPLTIDGDRGRAGRLRLVKAGGSWRIDALPTPTDETRPDDPAGTAFYARCWRAAGAQIAANATDIAFAAADRAVVALRADRVSAKGGDWRIFYTLAPGRRDPGLARVIRDPRAAAVVAYVENARANADVVERARACEAPD